MSGRRDANEGDEGEAGTRLLNTLVRTRLLVSVRAGQDNIETNLLRYTYVKGPGGANQDSGPRAYEITSGPTQRITLALRNDDLDADAPSLQALVARAEDPDVWASSSRLRRAALARGVPAGEAALALVQQALRLAPTCDDNDFTRPCARALQTAMQERIPSFSMVAPMPFLLLLQCLAQNCANWIVFPVTLLVLQTLGLLTGDPDADRDLLKEWGKALLRTQPRGAFWAALTFMGGEADQMAKAEDTFRASFRQWKAPSCRRLSEGQYEQLVSPLFVPRLRRFIYAIGGQGVAQLGTWLQFHQAPRAASAAICAGVVVDVFGKVATKEIVAALIACRADQILPAIEDYLYTQKGMARGDID